MPDPILPLILYLAAQALEGLRLKKYDTVCHWLCFVQFRLLYSLFSFYIISRSGTWSQLILCCFLFCAFPWAFFWKKRDHDTIQLLVDKSWRTCTFACDSFYALSDKGQEEHYATIADESETIFPGRIWRRAVKSSGTVRCDRAPIQQFKLRDHRGAE